MVMVVAMTMTVMLMLTLMLVSLVGGCPEIRFTLSRAINKKQLR